MGLSDAERREHGNECSNGPTASTLAGGRRLHLQHGPIDLIIEAHGESAQVRDAYQLASLHFNDVLKTLVDELAVLRYPATPSMADPTGPVARRMVAAVRPYCTRNFVTPMAAVAGSVADHVLTAMCSSTDLHRVYVNNGGDIALHLGDGATFRVAVCSNPASGTIDGRLVVCAGDGVGGIATSGWQGRSHSLGIADAVTVLAGDAARADVAATLIANAVDLPGSAAVTRVPANEISPDSDLGDRLVTKNVQTLDSRDRTRALQAGACVARDLIVEGLIESVVLSLQGHVQVCGRHRLESLPRDAIRRRMIATHAVEVVDAVY